MGKRGRRLILAAAALALAPFAATAEPGADVCGPFVSAAPVLAPVIATGLAGANDHSFGCLAWQSFIYLNWRARPDAPGEPDRAAPFAAPGATVWETFADAEALFRPNGVRPLAWEHASAGPRRLETTIQADGGILVDRTGKPVYYEIRLNRDEFAYIVANKLFDAEAQLAFAREQGIVLPTGPSAQYGPVGAIEVKAAWKVLTPAEAAERPRRFHAAEAILPDGSRALMGLVGFHLNQRVEGFAQGLWASFVQIDSAPLAGEGERRGRYSFFDPDCGGCAANAMTEPPQATQVEQVFPVAPSVRAINAYMRALIRATEPESPWQFYDLVGVQWPQFALSAPTPVPDPQRGARQMLPLSIGMPSTSTLMNPVLETFRQFPNVSCIGCHAQAATARRDARGAAYAADYSFLFRRAEAASRR
ncbi:MAG TPA: hypothetical protein VGU20_04140 [Stellaceae bacterium]|nr:hypothetical protein [Stellaceae bacterium]